MEPEEPEERSPKPIVLIGGAPGTGKSTLAGAVAARLRFDHRIGTGFIRAVLQSEVDPETEPALFTLTFRSEDPVAHLEHQARRLEPAVLACVSRARQEGTSLIIEGSHLIPALYSTAAVDLFVVLAAPAPDLHFARLTGPTHAHRAISGHDWRAVQRIDAYYKEEAERHGVRSVVYDDLGAILPLFGTAPGGRRTGRRYD